MTITSISAQNKESFRDKVFTGGNFGLSFGDVTFINLNPLLGYKLNAKTQIGISGMYQYYSQRVPAYETSTYGGGIFARYFVFENLFLHSEYEHLIGTWFPGENAFGITSLFIGGGYSVALSDRVAFTAMALFNLNQGVFSPYQNPIIRMGVNVGF